MRQIGKIIQKIMLLLAAGTAAGTILLTSAYLLPINQEDYGVLINKLKSAWYPRVSELAYNQDIYFSTYLPDVLDDSSDMIMLYTALDTTEGNPLVRAMNSYSIAAGKYSYYWHGYVSVLRPLLLLFDYSELRILNGACQLLLVVLLTVLIGRRKGIGHILMLVSSYILLNTLAMPLALQYTWIFYIAYIGTYILLRNQDYFLKDSRYIYFFVCTGMLTSYFDLLTYPLFTWGMPIVWWIVMRQEQENGRFWIRQVVSTALSWITGYAGMWIMKWVLGSVILKENIFRAAFDEACLRSGIQEKYELFNRLKAIYDNWKHYEYKVYAIVLIAWLLWWAYRTLKAGWYRSTKRYAYFLIGMSSIVWYLAFSNHVQAHHFFTYRILGVSVLAFFAMILDSDVAGGRLDWKKRVAVCCLWGGAMLLSLPLLLLAKEKMWIHNGTYSSYQQLEMTPDKMLEVEFIPSYDKIMQIDVGVGCEGEEGQFEVTLWKEGVSEYQEVIPVAECRTNFQMLDVAWKLEAHMPYNLSIQVVGNDKPAYVWVTDGGMPLSEYRNLSLGGEILEGQPLAGTIYLCRDAVSRKTLLFLLMTWTGIWIAAAYTLGPDILIDSTAMRQGEDTHAHRV